MSQDQIIVPTNEYEGEYFWDGKKLIPFDPEQHGLTIHYDCGPGGWFAPTCMKRVRGDVFTDGHLYYPLIEMPVDYENDPYLSIEEEGITHHYGCYRVSQRMATASAPYKGINVPLAFRHIKNAKNWVETH